MSKQSMGEWLRQNSEHVPVEIVLNDGERLKGTLLIPKERSIRDILNGQEPFLEFDCVDSGPTVLAKASIRSLRQFALPKAGQLAEHMRYLTAVGAFRALGLSENATPEDLEAAYHRLAMLYNPEDYPRGNVPDEIVDYVSSIARRLYLAFNEITAILEKREAAQRAAAEAAAQPQPDPAARPAGPKVTQPSMRRAAADAQQETANTAATQGNAGGQVQTLRKRMTVSAPSARPAT